MRSKLDVVSNDDVVPRCAGLDVHECARQAKCSKAIVYLVKLLDAVAQPAQKFGRDQKIFLGKNVCFRRITLFLFGIPPLKAQNVKIWGAHAPLTTTLIRSTGGCKV